MYVWGVSDLPPPPELPAMFYSWLYVFLNVFGCFTRRGNRSVENERGESFELMKTYARENDETISEHIFHQVAPQ